MAGLVSCAIHVGHRRRQGREPSRSHPSESCHAGASPAGPGARDVSGAMVRAVFWCVTGWAGARLVSLLQVTVVSRFCIAGRGRERVMA